MYYSYIEYWNSSVLSCKSLASLSQKPPLVRSLPNKQLVHFLFPLNVCVTVTSGGLVEHDVWLRAYAGIALLIIGRVQVTSVVVP